MTLNSFSMFILHMLFYSWLVFRGKHTITDIQKESEYVILLHVPVMGETFQKLHYETPKEMLLVSYVHYLCAPRFPSYFQRRCISDTWSRFLSFLCGYFHDNIAVDTFYMLLQFSSIIRLPIAKRANCNTSYSFTGNVWMFCINMHCVLLTIFTYVLTGSALKNVHDKMLLFHMLL